ncbi:non-specific lipid-transfer protein-like protein At2g13820 [Ananas comosus]|uniref:Non-specific lipid-transfer protein-like protein At2g13820 n=1 Tax=Ananas comosus TaxID=4615 RepID=A0A6P5F9K3_ANACO|nr:non-specific lipid-transfer protein-like protein At2g13820 [Ananas comosus]
MGQLLLLITTICVATSGDPLDCSDALGDLSPCLDYCTDDADYPSIDCCEQLPTVCRAQPVCFCAVVGGTSSDLLGIPIDTDRAVNLPDACDNDYDYGNSHVAPASVSTTLMVNTTTSTRPNPRQNKTNVAPPSSP